MLQILFAFLAGVLTIAAPCILPMLPILLGASVGQQSRQRPLFIVLGFIVSFSAAALVLSALIHSLGLSENTLRYTAITILAVFAVFMIWPKPFELLALYFSPAVNKAGQVGGGNGNMSGLLLGFVLGIVWTPCAGPILASILALIALQGSSTHSLILLLSYALGSGIPMLVIAYGSQYITTKVRSIARYSVRIQQAFGVLVLLLAVAMYYQYDTLLINKLSSFFPQSKLEEKLASSNNATVQQLNTLRSLGSAPEFTGISHWLNLQDGKQNLTLNELKGKVVLVDFWTYSCINCIRTLPYVTKWYDTYKDQGLVVVGVHTPEFDFEKVTSNVEAAIQHFHIHYPVAQDNDYGTWSAFRNQYWPAEYLIDQKGNIVYTHFGEGEYDHTENAIRQLLGLQNPVAQENGQDLSKVRSPEMYFEPARLEYLSGSQSYSASPKLYTFPEKLSLNSFALEGNWQFMEDNATLIGQTGGVRLHFSSGKVFMVAASKDTKPITLHIVVDGTKQSDVVVTGSDLYQLFDSVDYKEHTIDIQITAPGFEAFTFTFG